MMSVYLSTRIDMIDFLHCSSSVRTYETSKYFIERIKFIDIQYDESLYHSSSSEIINNIKCYDEQYNSAMIIAHNPGLTNLINEISDISLDNLPTTGLVEINFNCTKWSDISIDNSTVVDIKFPKQLK
jgi:phosphohistidine phosphatase